MRTSPPLTGVGLTNGITVMRKALDPNWAGPPNPSQDLLATSAAYGVYMSISSNLRYNLPLPQVSSLPSALSLDSLPIPPADTK